MDGPRAGAAALEVWGAAVLEERARAGVRNARPGQGERSILRCQVAGDALGARSLEAIESGDLRAWIERRAATGLSHKALKNALSLVRVILQAAVDAGMLERNVARDVRVPRSRGTRSTHAAELDGVLDPAEQAELGRALRTCAPAVRAMVLVAMGTGLRRGELLSLETSDVDVEGVEPALVVRYGARRAGAGERTKGARVRRLPLFGLGLVAMVEWLTARGEAVSGSPLVFPGPRRGARSKVPARELGAALALAGVLRSIRWHDLRHTCATSLLLGWWGPAWSVAQVQKMLGHSSPAVTEKYLHARNAGIFAAARATATRDVNETWPKAHPGPSLDPHGAQLSLFPSHPGELNPRAPGR